MTDSKFKIAIVGGGTAGIDVAARLAHHFPASEITVIDPTEKHFYQPLWTLVGGGEARKEDTCRNEADLIPPGVKWIQESVTQLLPDDNAVVTSGGNRITYEALVLCPGLRIDWGAIKGLPEALKNDPRVASNYDYNTVEKTWAGLQALKQGTAIFTQPSTPIKCGGAPQKIMYLAQDYWQRQGVAGNISVKGYFASASIFGNPHFVPALNKVVDRKHIEMHYRRDLVAIDHSTGTATFQNLDAPEEMEAVAYDFIHVTPKMFPPAFVAESPLAIADGPTKGWAEVDKNTLQNPKFPNVFALGDVAGIPTSKTGAAIRKQAVVVEQNVLAHMAGTPLPKQYDGYTSCPLVTGYGKLIMAEFGYDDKVLPSFPLDPTKERWSMYMLKKHFLPWMYWNLMLKGKA